MTRRQARRKRELGRSSFEETAKPTPDHAFLKYRCSLGTVGENLGRSAPILRVSVPKQRGHQLAKEVGLPVGRESYAAQVTRLEPVDQQPMRRPGDGEVGVVEDLGSVRELHGFQDANSDELDDLLGGEP